MCMTKTIYDVSMCVIIHVYVYVHVPETFGARPSYTLQYNIHLHIHITYYILHITYYIYIYIYIFSGNFRILKWRYVSTICLAIFYGDIPVNIGINIRYVNPNLDCHNRVPASDRSNPRPSVLRCCVPRPSHPDL